MRVILLALFTIAAGCATGTRGPASQSEPNHGVVVSYHPLATEIGNQILAAGGNAFDAFVATTMAQYVLSEGVTSLGGPLGALIYDAKSGQVLYLDAGFNSPRDSSGHFDPDHPENAAGATTFVPGAPAGLEAISKRFGKLPFATIVQPAIDLARNGFPVSTLMSRESKSFSAALLRSEYGKTYYPSGAPLVPGQTLKLPVVADTLTKLAREGSSYMYTGAWAKAAVQQIQATGGKLTLEDFARYKVDWREALSIDYRGARIYSPSGVTYDGLATLLALKALENTSLNGRHYSKDPAKLEKVIRAQDWADAYTLSYAYLNHGEKIKDQAFIQSAIIPNAKSIWDQIKTHKSPKSGDGGTHSYQVVVIDHDGNAITGTNTIESMPWGEGLFVDGIALTDSAVLRSQTLPGERNLMPLSMHMGMRENKVWFAVGAFGASLAPAELQYILNVVDYGLSAKDALSSPRFGINGIDFSNPPHYKPTGLGRWIDRRIDPKIVRQLIYSGVKLDRESQTVHGVEHFMDLGLGSLAVVQSDGGIDSAIAPMTVDPN